VPYKDQRRKKEWERLHRLARLARRRELRRMEPANLIVTKPLLSKYPWQTAVGAGLLAIYSPSLALVAGSVVLFLGIKWKKSLDWWVFGLVLVIVSLSSLMSKRSDESLDNFNKTDSS